MTLGTASASAQAPDPTATAAAPSPAGVGAPPAAPPPSSPPPAGDKQAEARARFNRALELYDDGDFDASLLELQRAYELAPSFRILYNIGLIYQQLKDYARALDAFDRYLREGGAEVPQDRVEDTQRRIDRLKDRVAYVSVETTPSGVEISVDDVVVGVTPLTSPLRVNSGLRRVSARLAGHPVDTRAIGLAGGERRSVVFDLQLPVVAPPPPPPRSHMVPYIAWGTTGAITIAAVTTGVLALGATSSYDAEVAKFGISPSDQSGAWEKAHHLALATDVLIAGALVAAGVSIVLTVRDHGEPSPVAITIGPGVVAGKF